MSATHGEEACFDLVEPASHDGDPIDEVDLASIECAIDVHEVEATSTSVEAWHTGYYPDTCDYYGDSVWLRCPNWQNLGFHGEGIHESHFPIQGEVTIDPPAYHHSRSDTCSSDGISTVRCTTYAEDTHDFASWGLSECWYAEASTSIQPGWNPALWLNNQVFMYNGHLYNGHSSDTDDDCWYD